MSETQKPLIDALCEMKITIELELPQQRERLNRILDVDEMWEALRDVHREAVLARKALSSSESDVATMMQAVHRALSTIERIARTAGRIVQ